MDRIGRPLEAAVSIEITVGDLGRLGWAGGSPV